MSGICSLFLHSLFHLIVFKMRIHWTSFFIFLSHYQNTRDPIFLSGCLSLSPIDRDCFHFLKDLNTLPFSTQLLKTRKYAILVFLWFTSFKRVIQLYTLHTTHRHPWHRFDYQLNRCRDYSYNEAKTKQFLSHHRLVEKL